MWPAIGVIEEPFVPPLASSARGTADLCPAQGNEMSKESQANFPQNNGSGRPNCPSDLKPSQALSYLAPRRTFSFHISSMRVQDQLECDIFQYCLGW